jgi:hypothetical protein
VLRVESPVCWIWLDQKIDGASGACTTHALRRGLGDPWKLRAPHGTVRLYNLVWTSSTSGPWPKAEPEATDRTWLFYSVPEWNADKTRVPTRFVIDCSRTPVPWNRFVQWSESAEECRSMERLDLVMRIPVTAYQRRSLAGLPSSCNP